MAKVFQIIQIVAAILLVVVVLLQQRGSSLSGAFGGSGAAFRSRRGIEKFLYYATIVIGVIFAAVSLAVIFWNK
jgi:protein translocase SecG subunit